MVCEEVISQVESTSKTGYWTMMCGADSNTATVAITVNNVNTIRQNLSTTMAANFQSLPTSCSSSFFLILLVMNCSSRRIVCSSLWAVEHPDVSSICELRRKLALTVLAATWVRKSSSMSNTFANKLLDERSFNSNSFILLLINIVFLVIFLPGLDIPNIQGNHWRNTLLIWNTQHTSHELLITPEL